MDYIVNEELETLLASFNYEEYGHDRLIGIKGTAEKLELQWIVSVLEGGREDQEWKITATQVLDSLLHLGDAGIAFSNDHPILHRYTKPSARLSIQGTPKNPLKLLEDLPSIRQTYSSNRVNLTVLIAGYGIVADGPLPWVEEVARLLEKHDVATNVMLNAGWRPKKPIALLMSRGYVIAETMIVEKLP